MPPIELLDFQRAAADTIAARFLEYASDPVQFGSKKKLHSVPFYQALASITASGKTVILADAVAAIRATLPVAPVVLWLSKGKVVVEQTLVNLSPGGQYHHLLGDFDVHALADYDSDDVAQANAGIVFFATVGTFNQKDKENGTLLVHRCEIDTAERSTWDALGLRLDANATRRPLIIVYDEAHNLTDQQTELLLELEPDAFIGASATMKLPSKLAAEVQQLRQSGRDDTWLTTTVDAKQVADSGLVKNTVYLGGYQAPMEETVNALIAEFKKIERDVKKYNVPGKPKAIYVSNTNVLADGSNEKDNPKRPFAQREAPPILIWRHLTEHHKVPPSQIAVYCSLKFDKAFPPPAGFMLFTGGDSDYYSFTSGDFRHIIFNLSLQEGWDDPSCYLAYIDKSMQSRVQIEQIVGRLLRQPGIEHYPAQRLNTAHFYIRVDKKQVFADSLKAVGKKLKTDAPQIRLIESSPGKAQPVELEPKPVLSVPETALESEDAVSPIEAIMKKMTDYRNDSGSNTIADGSRVVVRRKVGVSSSGEASWETFEQSSTVRARWLFEREVRRKHSGALGVVDRSDGKLDALIGFGSPAAAHIADIATQVVEAYIDNVYISQREQKPYVVGEQKVRLEVAEKFKNSLHKAYDGLNDLEERFAFALDAVGYKWCRNLPRTGYGIPLITLGPTNYFYPDFLVWKDDDVFALDTKGGHLLAEAATRKLLRIDRGNSKTRLFVRLISEGRWSVSADRIDDEGFTIWGVKQDGSRRATQVEDLEDAVARVLKP
jgi:type III restriction enzyme